MALEEWVIGICGSSMKNFGLGFGQDGGVEQVSIKCMCSGIQESSSQQEDVVQGSRCSQGFLSGMYRNSQEAFESLRLSVDC